MEYIWPARKNRRQIDLKEDSESCPQDPVLEFMNPTSRPHYDHKLRPSTLHLRSHNSRRSLESNTLSPDHPPKLGTSRSFSDLRSTALGRPLPMSHRNHSTDALSASSSSADVSLAKKLQPHGGMDETNDAAEMKSRSSQKMLVSVDIPRYDTDMSYFPPYLTEEPLFSLHLLLSIMKEGSFLCHDARICTRDLRYRNQVWSVSIISWHI
jgi:hypothetical protein